MKLNSKLRLVIIISMIAFVIIGGSLSNYINHKNNMRVEAFYFQDIMEGIKRELINEIDTFETVLTDWAVWDSMYELLDNYDQEFIDENFVDGTYDLYNIDYVIIADDDDEVLYSGYYDGEIVTDVPENILLDFSFFKNEFGILKTDEGLILFVSKKLNNSSESAIPKGSIVFARKINESYKEKMEYRFNDKFELYIGKKSILNSTESSYGTATKLEHNTDKDSIIHFELPILNSDDVMVLKFHLKNQVQDLTREYNLMSIIMIIVILSLLGITLDVLLKNTIINRIINLNKQISRIKCLNNMTERVEDAGEDEIGELSDSINDMLAEIDNMHEKIMVYANYDEMTGVYSRKKGFSTLEEDFKSAMSGDLILSLIYFDVDNLKIINDTYGHAMGDHLISDAAMMMKKFLSDDDYIIRVGGDEFLMILKGKNNKEANILVKTLEKQLKEFNNVNDRSYEVSLSSGVSSYNDETELDELIEKADNEMYSFKKYRKQSR